jgi:hypothetical protein
LEKENWAHWKNFPFPKCVPKIDILILWKRKNSAINFLFQLFRKVDTKKYFFQEIDVLEKEISTFCPKNGSNFEKKSMKISAC